MGDDVWLAGQFELHRPRLRAIAYRMLGSDSEADDAVQEVWLRISRRGIQDVQNLGGWLTTIAGRICLDQLRSRAARREEPLDVADLRGHPPAAEQVDPEQEAVLADSVGIALLVVLDTLAPAERLAFVLHDMFAVPFAEIAAMIGRSPDAAKTLASRARRRIRSAGTVETDVARQRDVVNAFLAASREGNFEALLAVLDPDVVVRADAAAVPAGAPTHQRGARAVAQQALAFSQRVPDATLAMVDGTIGIVVAPRGRVSTVLAFAIAHGRIVAIDVLAEPERLRRLHLVAVHMQHSAAGVRPPC